MGRQTLGWDSGPLVPVLWLCGKPVCPDYTECILDRSFRSVSAVLRVGISPHRSHVRHRWGSDEGCSLRRDTRDGGDGSVFADDVCCRHHRASGANLDPDRFVLPAVYALLDADAACDYEGAVVGRAGQPRTSCCLRLCADAVCRQGV